MYNARGPRLPRSRRLARISALVRTRRRASPPGMALHLLLVMDGVQWAQVTQRSPCQAQEGASVFLNMLMAVQDAGTAKEAAEYAAREVLATPGLENFPGGASIAVPGLLVVVLVVILIIWLL